ncbi:MAG: adenosine kinase [Bacteroidota bacterium]
MQKIIGLGNALVDVITEVDDELILKKLNLPKGSMTLVDEQMSRQVSTQTTFLKKTQASGGSAANTIHGLAKLGAPVSFIGKVGEDETGDFFIKDMQDNGIKPFLIRSKKDTGKAQALITKDAERTFATSLGAAVELSAADIEETLFEDHQILYVEGYLVQNQELMEKSLRLAKQMNMKVVLDLASYNIVEDNLSFLERMVGQYVDILFANEEEARAFTGESVPEKALLKISAKTEIAVVKTGKEGSLIRHNGEIFTIRINQIKGIDTTGAGDLYAAGFLYAYIHNQPIEVCGEIGSLLAENVIQGIGAKIPAEKWQSIQDKIKKIMH